MKLKTSVLRFLPVVGTLCLIGAGAPMNPAHAAPSFQVIASGLDNPRGLAFDAVGQLYVAEAGRGGAGPCVDGPEGKACFGSSGAITRIFHGYQQRIVSGLPSMADEDGSNATGPNDVAVMHPGALKVVLGLGGNAQGRDSADGPMGALGHLIEISIGHPAGKVEVDWTHAVDLAAFEQVHNPDGGENDTNPYAVTADASGRAVVADAGGNDLLRVSRDGTVTPITVFPERMVEAPPFLNLPVGSKIPMQSVPTSIAAGNHGEYYVGELTGFPFPKGAARVYLVNDTRGANTQVFADGFTNIIDLAVGKDGSLYVLEIAKDGLLAAEQGTPPTGELIRISPNGARTTLMTNGLVAPGGMTIGPDNALYISNYGVFPGKGEVIRVPA